MYIYASSIKTAFRSVLFDRSALTDREEHFSNISKQNYIEEARRECEEIDYDICI